MITIKLSPVLSDKETVSISVFGQMIIINNEEFDFTDLPNGYQMEPVHIESEWFVDTVYKYDNGDLYMTIKFPHPFDAGDDMKFPEQIIVKEDGVVKLPIYVPTILEVIENEETGLLEIATDTIPDGFGYSGEETTGDDLPSAN